MIQRHRLFARYGKKANALFKRPDGRLIVIVGPSGSGKDTLINWLSEKLALDENVMFARRTVTRNKDVSVEDHHSLSSEQFEAFARSGKFAVTWHAHGLRYGIPMHALAHVKSGGITIANGSRRALPQLAEMFGEIFVINLSVDRSTLATRLAARGREDTGQIQRRLDRIDTPIPSQFDMIQIDNSDKIEMAGKAVLKIVASLAQRQNSAEN